MSGSRRLTEALCRLLAETVNGKTGRMVDAGSLYWTIFADLHCARQWTETGPQPLSYRELAAYCQCMKWPLRPQDVAIIRAMDRAYVEAFHKSETAASAAPKQALTPAIFDAMVG